MSRQPPGGTSTICFGNDESPFKHSAPGFDAGTPTAVKLAGSSGIASAGELNAEQKAQIHAIVDETSDAEELFVRLSDLLSIGPPTASRGIEGHAVPPSLARGLKIAGQKVESAMASLRAAMQTRGVDSLARLAKKFRIMDDNNSRQLCYDELKKGIIESGCILDEGELQAVFRFFDSDCSGGISIDELLMGIRGQLNERRMAIVMEAFETLDVNGDGALTVIDLAGVYDCSRHPDVVSGIATEVDVQQNFLSNFNGTMSAPTKIVTPEKFAAYYAGISCSIDDDDYFELMVRNVWHLSGGSGITENTSSRRLLVTNDDGSQSIEVLNDDIFVTKEDLQEMKRRLVDQGVPVVKISLYGDLTSNDVPTTSSPKKAQPPRPSDEEFVIATTYKQRMAASSVTF